MNRNEQLAVYWTRAQPTVAAFITSLVGDFNDAEDILQQVAVALVRKFDEYDPGRPFVAWAIGIARLEVLRHRRDRAVESRRFSDAMIDQIAQTYDEMTGELDDTRRELGKCLDQVEGRSREALELRYMDDLKPAAIAERMGMAAGAVRVLLHRVRAALRECVDRRLSRAAETDPTRQPG